MADERTREQMAQETHDNLVNTSTFIRSWPAFEEKGESAPDQEVTEEGTNTGTASTDTASTKTPTKTKEWGIVN